MKPGAFRVDALAVIQRQGRWPENAPVGWSVGLLIAAPDPEGGNVQEVDAAGYARQPIEFFEDFAGGCRGTLQNSQRVSFEPVHAWEEATHVGIFDGELLAASGPLVRSAGHAGPLEVAFAVTAIQVRFSRRAY
jgi:hypothetical protein